MKSVIKDLCPPFLWRTLQNVRRRVQPFQVRTNADNQDLDLYWTPEMAQVLETWADGNAWLEVQFLMANCEGKVLDIACGTGKTMTILNRERLDLYGCDISDLLIGKAIDRGLPRESLRVCDATQLPYADGEFDYSYSIGSLEHFTEDGIVKFIEEASRVTKAGSFHMMPTSRSGQDEGWMKTYQSFHNSSPQWWVARFEKKFSRVVVLDSNWNDHISIGKWFLCYH
ncbi:MAG: class I SAM-dependent methyltransferase [Afipia sp.]|nr:class I SAM-dependent methyltransferase [Afipia sp.]